MSEELKTRVLMKNGTWLVPEPERPAKWRQMNLREPEPAKAPDTPAPAMGSLLDAAVEKTETEPKAVPKTPTVASIRKGLKPYFPVIEKSGEWFGAEPSLILHAKILFAGMWTREPELISDALNCRISTVKAAAERLAQCGLWCDDGHSVVLGEEKDGDITIWLNAMTADGTLLAKQDDKGDWLYRLRENAA